MKSIIFRIQILLFSITLVSCQKEQSRSAASSSTGDIKGTYNLVSMHVKTTSTNQSVSGADIYKTITLSEYDTQDNTGTLTIDASNVSSKNIGYSVNSTAKATYYENGLLIDTFSFPLQITLPPSSATGAYKQINADSLYFPSGLLFSGTNQLAQPSGVKLKMVNGNLTFTSNVLETSTQTSQGETVTITAEGTSVATLKKQ